MFHLRDVISFFLKLVEVGHSHTFDSIMVITTTPDILFAFPFFWWVHTVLHPMLGFHLNFWININLDNSSSSVVMDFFSLLIVLNCWSSWSFNKFIPLSIDFLWNSNCNVWIFQCITNVDMTQSDWIVWHLVFIDVERDPSSFLVFKVKYFTWTVSMRNFEGRKLFFVSFKRKSQWSYCTLPTCGRNFFISFMNGVYCTV